MSQGSYEHDPGVFGEGFRGLLSNMIKIFSVFLFFAFLVVNSSSFYINTAYAATVPGSPTGLTATGGNTKGILSWTAPDNGGSAITDYVVDFKLSASPTWSTFADGTSTAISATVTGLTNGSSYDFRVSAVNAIGQGSPCTPVTTIPNVVPGTPTIGTATAGDAQATVTFSAPSTGAPILYYTATASTNGGSASATSAGSPITVTGLTNGVFYTLKVTATNAIGTGAASSASNSVVPSSATNNAIYATAGTTTWTAPANVYSVTVELRGSGGGGATAGSAQFGGGGGGGGYSKSQISVTPGSNYTIVVGAGGTVDHDGNDTTFGSTIVVAKGGKKGTAGSPTGTGGTGGLAGTGDTSYAGGTAGNGSHYILSGSLNYYVGGGGSGGAGNASVGGDAGNSNTNTGGTGGAVGGGNGGNGGEIMAFSPTVVLVGNPGIQPGGGGGGGVYYSTYNRAAAAGADGEVVLTFAPATAPGAPTGVTATPGNAQATVTFAAPSTGGSPITGYTVTSSPAGGVDTNAGTTALTHTVTGLTNNTLYSFTVTATNVVGTGSPSSASNTVTPAGVPDAPTINTMTPGPAQVYLSWNTPSNNGSPITDYIVDFKLHSDSSWTNFPHTPASTATTTTVTGVGLVNGSEYDFRVKAQNGVGWGDYSATASATLATVPGVPTDVTATAGNAQATVSFTTPDSGGSPIIGYTVTSNPGGITGTGASSPITVTGLTSGTTYSFTVTATNVIGTGLASSASDPVTLFTKPNAPTAVSATAGDRQVLLTWDASYNGGSTITDYAIDRKLTSEPDSSWATISDGVSALTNATITGLTNGLSYDFRVSAINVIGQGSPSATASATPITIPGAPTSVAAIRGDKQITVTFSSPTQTGGGVTNYTVTSSPDGHIGTGSTSPITVTGLTNGTSYTFTVTAANAAGTGPASSPSDPITPATYPEAPTSVTATAGNTKATVTFVAPLDGGSSITGYTVTANPSDGIDSNAGSTSLSHVVTSLTNGKSYTFTIVATNTVGTGPASSASDPITLPTEPGIPINLAAAIKGSSILLTWSTPPDGGSVITDYVIEYELSTGGTWAIFADGKSVDTTALVTELSNNTSYNFRVSAVNTVGQSAPSTSVTAAPGEPAQVRIQSFPDLTASSISTSILITNEGSGAYEYQYAWCITNSADNLCGGGDDVFDASNAKLIQPHENFNTILNSTIPSSGTYWFHIKVLYGSESSAAYQSFTAVATYPSAPTLVTATAGNAQSTVAFRPSTDNGGQAITGYTVTANPGGLTEIGTGSPITVKGLTDGITYRFTVAATNAIGTGPASLQSNPVTPVTVPDAPIAISATAGNRQVLLTWITPAFNGGLAITDYVIDYKLSSDSVWTTFADGASTETTATITGLKNNLSYDFRVSAVNAFGQSSINSISATLPTTKHTLTAIPTTATTQPMRIRNEVSAVPSKISITPTLSMTDVLEKLWIQIVASIVGIITFVCLAIFFKIRFI